MKKHRTAIIFGVAAVLILGVLFLWGELSGDSGDGAPPDAAVTADTFTPPTESKAPETVTPPDATPSEAAASPDTPASVTETPSPDDSPPTATKKPDGTPAASESPPPSESAPPPESPEPSATPDTPEPTDSGELTCTLVISCATVLDNMDKLREGKEELIPADGIIFSKSVVFYEGESAFEVLRRETKAGRIHLEYVEAPLYGSAYIEGIGNLYEFDCGERSGWMYSVNGVFPNYGSSKYTLVAGDRIEWLFTCDRGADIGGADAADSYVKG